MTRSRLVLLAASLVVILGALGAAGALYLDPARAAVGPLPPEALSLPGDTRFVMGLDVKRFVASPFYKRMNTAATASRRTGPFAEIEEKTGLNPERDIDQIIVAGGGQGIRAGRGGQGAVIVLGRFDRYKVSRAIETESKKGVTTKTLQGTTIYLFNEGQTGDAAAAVAFVDDGALVMGSQRDVEHVVSARSRGEATLSGNAALLALLESVRPGSTFWVAGDQTALQGLPRSLPGAGGPEGTSQSIELPALKSVIVTGDLDPEVALDVTGEALDEAAARNLADVVRGFVALASLQAGQKPELKQLASAVSVTTEQTRVRVNARFPYELLDSLQKGRPGAAVSSLPDASN
jgi:hypothetical protein